MMRSYIVGYSGVRGDASVAIQNDDGSTLGSWHYRVEVEIPQGGATEDHLRAIALQKAGALYAAALNVVPGTPLPSSSSKTVGGKVKKPEPAFEADQIMPFVLAARRDVVAIAGRPIRLELTGDEATASTDCRSNVWVNPEPFLMGFLEAGRGRIYHEGSHIRFDPRAPQLLAKAAEQGGSLLQHILNVVLDRRSDNLNCAHHPGFRLPIRRRLGHLLPGASGPNGVSTEARADVFVDFVFACKKRTRPCHAIVKKCVDIVSKAIRDVNRKRRSYDHLLLASHRVLDLLMQALPNEVRQQMEAQAQFERFMKRLMRAVHGGKAGPLAQKAFRQAIATRLDAERRATAQSLPQRVQAMPVQGPMHIDLDKGDEDVPNEPGRGRGQSRHGQVIDVALNHAAYAASLERVRHWIPHLRLVLEELAQPRVIDYHGLDRGDFDEDELPAFVAGGTDVFMRSEEEPELDVAISFLLDISGSMAGNPATIDMGTLFSEVLLEARGMEGSFFAFHDDVFRCGKAARGNGIASLKWAGGTNEAFGLREAAKPLLVSARRRKVLITVCDGGPADVKAVERVCEKLLQVGILPVRLLVGVDAAPSTYPVELFFDSFEEAFKELVGLFRSLMLACRS